MRSLPFNDAFFAGLGTSVQDVNASETLPPLCYTDADFYEFEKACVFGHDWLCVGRASWLAEPGDYFTIRHAQEPLVVVRTEAGEIRAMSTVCQHRAMLVAEGQGKTRAFLCPYHHWSYALDGRLVGAPAMDRACDFDKSQIRLPQLRVEIWLGFIFVNFDADAAPLAPRLAALTEALAHYDMGALGGPPPGPPASFAWNWKVMFENNNDGYHANRLHAGPLHNIVPSALCSFPDLPADTAGYFRYNGTLHQDAAFNATLRALLPVFPGLTSEDRNRMIFANVPPSLSLVIRSDGITYIILCADGAERVNVTRGVLLAPGAMQDPLFAEKMAMGDAATADIVAQDLHVDAQIAIGLKSRFATRGRYSWQEQAQRELNGWLVPRYQAGWAAHRNAG